MSFAKKDILKFVKRIKFEYSNRLDLLFDFKLRRNNAHFLQTQKPWKNLSRNFNLIQKKELFYVNKFYLREFESVN